MIPYLIIDIVLTLKKKKTFVRAFFRSALYFLAVYFPLQLNLHLVLLLVSFCF